MPFNAFLFRAVDQLCNQILSRDKSEIPSGTAIIPFTFLLTDANDMATRNSSSPNSWKTTDRQSMDARWLLSSPPQRPPGFWSPLAALRIRVACLGQESRNPSQIPSFGTGAWVSSVPKGSTAGFISQPVWCHPMRPNFQHPKWKPDGNWKKNQDTPKKAERVHMDCPFPPKLALACQTT